MTYANLNNHWSTFAHPVHDKIGLIRKSERRPPWENKFPRGSSSGILRLSDSFAYQDGNSEQFWAIVVRQQLYVLRYCTFLLVITFLSAPCPAGKFGIWYQRPSHNPFHFKLVDFMNINIVGVEPQQLFELRGQDLMIPTQQVVVGCLQQLEVLCRFFAIVWVLVQMTFSCFCVVQTFEMALTPGASSAEPQEGQ